MGSREEEGSRPAEPLTGTGKDSGAVVFIWKEPLVNLETRQPKAERVRSDRLRDTTAPLLPGCAESTVQASNQKISTASLLFSFIILAADSSAATHIWLETPLIKAAHLHSVS